MNAECLFDQGDCCDKTLIGNNECNAVNNFAQCSFDGGDCGAIGKINQSKIIIEDNDGKNVNSNQT